MLKLMFEKYTKFTSATPGLLSILSSEDEYTSQDENKEESSNDNSSEADTMPKYVNGIR